MTVLELLVALGIVAGATAMAAGSLSGRPDADLKATDRLAAFVTEARLTAQRTGRPVLLEIGPDAARFGERRLAWAASDLRVRYPGPASGGYRAIVSPQGVIGGSPIGVEAGGSISALPGVYREPAP